MLAKVCAGVLPTVTGARSRIDSGIMAFAARGTRSLFVVPDPASQEVGQLDIAFFNLAEQIAQRVPDAVEGRHAALSLKPLRQPWSASRS